jgi:transglutaminase-like putative cysteine protease
MLKIQTVYYIFEAKPKIMKVFFTAFFLMPFFLCAQEINDDFIFLNRSESIKIELENERFSITKDINKKGKYLTSNKLFFANEYIPFDSFHEIEAIEAYTLLPESGKKIPVDHIETKHEFDNGVFFSDQQIKSFVFPAVSKGAETVLKYKQRIKDPHFLGSFRFGSYAPTKTASLEIEFPKNVEIGYKTFHTDGYDIVFEKKETPKSYIYSWRGDNIKDFRKEENSLSPSYYIPHIILYIKEYQGKKGSVPVLSSVSDLYAWYRSLIKQISKQELKTVYKTAEMLAAAQTKKSDKAKAIFNWVQNNITYIAFEDGLGGFIPRNAETVCTKRYGDCKDMANLLYEMLNHVEIEAYHAWIGTRERPYLYDEVPTPIADNHMITAAIIENDTIFLDATDSYVPYGMPSAFTQGKEALIGIDDENFIIKKVPISNAKKSKTLVNTELILLNDAVSAHQKRIFTGYEKVDFISDYTYNKDTKTNEEYLNTTLKLGNNKTAYTNIKLSDLEDRTNTLLLSFDLTLKNYAKNIAGRVFLNLNLDRSLAESDVDIEKQRYAKKIDYHFEKTFQTAVKIPEGYEALKLPEKQSFDSPEYGFEIAYEIIGDQVVMNKHIYVKTLVIDNNEFSKWNQFIKSLVKAYKKSITLKKKL